MAVGVDLETSLAMSLTAVGCVRKAAQRPCDSWTALDAHPEESARRLRAQVNPPPHGNRYFGQIYPVPLGDLKQPTDSGMTCFGNQSTIDGK